MNEEIKAKIRTIPNWPKKGIMFRDITTLIKEKEGLNDTVQKLHEHYRDKDVDVVAGIESRGFIFGTALALLMNKGFVLIRKKGSSPAWVRFLRIVATKLCGTFSIILLCNFRALPDTLLYPAVSSSSGFNQVGIALLKYNIPFLTGRSRESESKNSLIW